MNNCALICEYNPFHSGHAYQLEKIRECGVDNIICVMSGNFTQNGLPAFCPKELRAECAIRAGSDAVIELPTLYATASAGYFADGAVKIISEIKGIRMLAMGVTVDPSIVLRLADIKILHADEFSAELSKQLAVGKSYNAANMLAFCALYEKLYCDGMCDISSAISDPNNMLAVEYITAIAKHSANIVPMPIMRIGASHGDKTIDGEYVSATAIRNAFEIGNATATYKFIPYELDRICEFRRSHAPNISTYKKLAVYALKSMTYEQVSTLRNCSEGMEYLIGKIKSNDYDDIISASECKRYGKKRIARLFLDAALGIEKGLTEHKFCTRLLAKKREFDVSILPECVKMRNSDIKQAANDDEVRAVLSIDERATILYNTITELEGGYYNFKTVVV